VSNGSGFILRWVIIRMVIHRPDFIVIGAMKSATSTLHEQLAHQPGLFMSRPKEPNFFSDDGNYARGWKWYSSIFRPADPADLCGESSTHYSKLPTYPRTVARMARDLPRLKLIYLIRHPIDRMISHYMHEMTTGRIAAGIEEGLDHHPELIDYSRYSMQLQPYLDAYGFENVLLVFFPRLVNHSQAELERIGRFLNHGTRLIWDDSIKAQNMSTERLRASSVRNVLVQAPVLTSLRKRIVPYHWSQSLKDYWRARIDRPVITAELTERLRDVFDADLAQLGSWLGTTLDCDNFHEVTLACSRDWTTPRTSVKPGRGSMNNADDLSRGVCRHEP
jgi:Sulfotransferase family